MSFESYSKGLIYHDNKLLAEARSFTISYNANNNDVTTLAKRGLAGQTQGSPTADVSMDCAVLKAGYEVDFDSLMLDNSNHTISFLGGGVVKSVEGRYQSVEFSGATDSALMYKVTFRGNIVEE